MSKKTSTAALDSFREGQLPNRRRAPRHSTGEKRSNEIKRQRSNEPEREFGHARIAVRKEDIVNGNNTKLLPRRIRTILPVILRITFCLLVWTLGVASITLVEAQTIEHHVVHKLPVNRTRIENLQRWVNNGHDTWCRDPKSVATATVRRLSPEFAHYDFELASLTTQEGEPSANKAAYTFHSLDGRTSYRVTLRRFKWQTKIAGSSRRRVWVPVRTETITRDSLD
jgi:hypothetical protein